jgi:hypothetical protein
VLVLGLLVLLPVVLALLPLVEPESLDDDNDDEGDVELKDPLEGDVELNELLDGLLKPP